MSGMSQIIGVVFAVGLTIATGGLAAPLALGGGLFSSLAAGVGLTGTLGSIVAGAASSALTGALIGGIGSAITGGDFLDGVKNGAIGGAITGGLGGAFGGLGGGLNPTVTAGEESLGTLDVGGMGATEASGGGDFIGALSSSGNGAGATISTGGSGGLVSNVPASEYAGGASVNGGNINETTGTSDIFGTGGGAVAGPNVATNTGGAASNYVASGNGGAAGAPTGSGGLLDGVFDKQTIGGALAGAGKVLSGDTVRAGAQEQNRGALERQDDAQNYVSANYGPGSGGLIDASTVDSGTGRPTPQQAFAQPTQTAAGRYEYFYDPTTRSLQRRLIAAAVS